MNNMKSQSALEYLIIIAITLGVIVPTTYLFFTYSAKSSLQITDSQINNIGNVLTDTAESVYYSGKDSKIVVDLNVPDAVDNLTIIDNRELVFGLDTEIGKYDLVYFSKVNLTSNSCSGNACDLNDIVTGGLNKVRIQAIGGGKVLIVKEE